MFDKFFLTGEVFTKYSCIQQNRQVHHCYCKDKKMSRSLFYDKPRYVTMGY